MDAKTQFLAALARRGYMAEGGLTIYGEPTWRAVAAGAEPQALMEASVAQRNIVACAHATPALVGEFCAGWIEDVFAAYGVGLDAGDACELYERYCTLESTAELKVGMVIAVPRAPYTVASARYGHAGLYVGDGQVMDCADGRVRTLPLELWLSNYGIQAPPRWGWLGGVALG